MFEMENVKGGSPYGAGTLAGDGSRQPSELELQQAFHQGKYFAAIAKKLKGNWLFSIILSYNSSHPAILISSPSPYIYLSISLSLSIYIYSSSLFKNLLCPVEYLCCLWFVYLLKLTQLPNIIIYQIYLLIKVPHTPDKKILGI